jgi:hypothetical protein
VGAQDVAHIQNSEWNAGFSMPVMTFSISRQFKTEILNDLAMTIHGWTTEWPYNLALAVLVSYRLIEQPFLRLKDRLRRSRPASNVPVEGAQPTVQASSAMSHEFGC